MKKVLTILMMALLAAGVGWAADTWQETAASDLSTGDFVVIVDKTSGMAMSNDKGTSSPPVATEVSFISNKTQISAPLEKIQWEVTVTNGSYKFNVPGTSNYLYCNDSNNGVRVGSSNNALTNNTFTIFNNNSDVPFLLNTATSRYLGVYNSTDWRCYTSINSNIEKCVLAFYKKVGTASAVATPVISGTTPFVGSTQVSINCETSGASIYYTLDGSDPSTSSTLYINPFTINATTTVKAIAALNGETSNIATKAFTAINSIASIAEFNTLATGAIFKYTADNLVYIVSNASGNNHYVQDGSKGMLIYGSLGQSYTAGDVIPSGFTGTRAEYNGAPEMTNPSGFGAPMRNTGLTPVEIVAGDVTLDNFGRYVVLKNATIDGTNLVVDGENVSFHNSLGATVPTETEGKTFDVTGVVGAYNGNAQILPIEFTDVTPVTGPEYYLVGSFNENDGVWVQQDPDYKFTKRADGSYILNDVELAEGVEFKIIKVDGDVTTWYGGTITDGGSYYGVNGNVHNNLPLDNTDNGKNFKLEVAGTNDFVISSDMKLTVNRDAALYMKGSYSNDDWATKTPLTATNDGWTITMDMAADTEFGFVDEWNTWHGGNGYWIKAEHMGTEIPIVANGNFVMKVASNFTLNINSALTKLVVTDNNAVVEGGYVKVTSAADLTSGTYLIVYEDGSLAFNGGLETLDAVGNSIAVTISNNTIPSSAEVDAATFTYDADAGTLKSASGYYIGQTSDANGLASSATNAYTNTVTIDADGNADIVSSGGAYLRYNAASNQTRFRYYKSSTYSSQKAIQLYKKSGEVAPTLPTPVISGDSPFSGSTTVTISCDDTEAEVRYTLDGTDPTAESTLYQASFTISETTTVKAKAFKGEEFSNVASKEFKKTVSVATIAEYKELGDNTTFVFTGNVTVTYVNGRNLYVKDDTGSALIYGNEDFTGFEQGQVLASNWTATTTRYNGLLEAKNPSSLAATEQTVEVSPVDKNVNAITTANDNEYIIVKNVTISAVDNRNFTITDANGNTITGRTYFTDVDHPTDLDSKYDITCVVSEYNGTVQLYPTAYTKAVETVVLDGVAFTANSQWATWYGDANLALPEQVAAYVVTGVQGDAVAVEAVDYIPANTGVLLYSETAAQSVSAMPTEATGTAPTSLLAGSLEDQTITEGYVLYNNTFYRSEEGTLAAHRCYLPMTQVAGAPRMLMIGASDVPTAIESIIAQGNVAGIKYVNLSGMTSDEPWRGVNIAVITLTDGTTRTVKVIK